MNVGDDADAWALFFWLAKITIGPQPVMNIDLQLYGRASDIVQRAHQRNSCTPIVDYGYEHARLDH
jgi:hypothetical protein